MTATPVLIAAYSGRTLAASARRAGYVPLVADSYADSDTRSLAHAVEHLSGTVAHGFRTKPLLEAFDRLSAQCQAAPCGLVVGSGFEDTPALLESLEKHVTLLGCSPETVRKCSDPSVLFPLLQDIGIPHPETRMLPPDDGKGWLSKRVGGSGGTHIARCKPKPAATPNRYFQRQCPGRPLSALAITSAKGTAFAFSKQWCNPLPRRPFRYGGAAGNITLPAELESNLIDIMLALLEPLDLVGLVSFDFLVDGGDVLLIDVNPRPGAALDVLDDDQGTLFKAHIAAATGDDPIEVLKDGWSPASRAAAYLYADHGTITVPDTAWPEWTADRPIPGSVIEQHHPLATVIVQSDDAASAETECRARLAQLEQMLYESKKLEDAKP